MHREILIICSHAINICTCLSSDHIRRRAIPHLLFQSLFLKYLDECELPAFHSTLTTQG